MPSMSRTEVLRHDLSAVVVADWFSPDLESQRELRLLVEVLGERFLAFAWIAGVRFTALVLDEAVPHASEVEIQVGEGQDVARGRMSVAELQRRLVAALLTEESVPLESPWPEEPNEAQLRNAVGGSWLLLGPLFGLVPRALLVQDGEPVALELDRAGERMELPLDVYRQLVRQLVTEELARVERGRTVTLDARDLERAEHAAEEGRWEEVVRHLGAWPRHLLLAVRSGVGEAMRASERQDMARALGLLGIAAAHLEDDDRFEETFRIGLQWASAVGGEVAAGLFLHHGEACVLRGRFGEALAPLERARRLGAAPERVLPLLAEAYLERGRAVATLGILRRASEAGLSAPRLQACAERLEERFGDVLGRWRRAVVSEAG